VAERNEEGAQEAHRQLIELLNDLRVALPGVQVLFAFLLTVPFTQGWGKVSAFQQDLYFATLLCSAVASAFLIAPSAIHRLDFRRADKQRIVAVSNVLSIVGLTFLALAIVGVVCLITDLLYGGAAVVAYTVVIAALFAVLWYTIPLVLRVRGVKSTPRS
jgi:O-antigen/teichoic acid export membrane protein